MNKFNSADFNPENVTIPSNDFFSFLDNEVYYIGALEQGECSRFIKANEEGKVLTYDSSSKNPFIFKWKGTGYVICTGNDPSMVLTLKAANEPGRFMVSVEKYQNRSDQIWDVVAYRGDSSGPSGVSIRSAIKQSGGYIYIGWDSYSVTATREMQTNTSLMLCPLSSSWINFGMACMQYLGWITVTEEDVTKALNNYYSNILTNISPENAILCNGTGLIVNQNGGNFSRLHYADVFMSEVACEVIAVCNAIRMVTGDFDENNFDFFKLTVEFELSGLYRNSFKKFIVNTGAAMGIRKLSSVTTSAGGWGGDPEKIGNCFEAHNIKFKSIHIKDQRGMTKDTKSAEAMLKINTELEDAVCAVVSYNFSTLHQAIHTFMCVSSNEGTATFNRHCAYTPSGHYNNMALRPNERGVYSSITEAVSSEKDAWFLTGYLLYR